MSSTLSAAENAPRVNTITYPTQSPHTVYACCACHRLRAKLNENCHHCNHHGHCCVFCEPGTAPGKWSANEVPLEYIAELREYQKPKPVVAATVNYNYADTVTLHGGMEADRRGENGRWIVLVLLLIIVLLLLDRSHLIAKYEGELAVLRRGTNISNKALRLEQQVEALEALFAQKMARG